MSLLPQSIFAERRGRLAQLMGPDAVAIIATRAELFRNRDADYKYRADSSFFYLTGFAEPEAVAVLQTDNCGELRYTLFCRPRDRAMEIWNGYRAGLDGAVSQYAADEAFEIEKLDHKIPALIDGKTSLFARFGLDREFDARLSRWFAQLASQQRAGKHGPAAMRQLDDLIDDMRLIKSPEEIALMQKAADISAAAHVRAMQMVHPGMFEYALEAELLYEFARHGTVPAYNSIVGGGANGCILHYVENNQPLRDGDLVLIDAGCEYQHYAADITRTFPVNGRFTGEQRALYEVVLSAQHAAIACMQPGQSCKAGHHAAIRVLTEGLCALGLLQGEINELIENERYRSFYMHGTGHWLGMDVHDVGTYKCGDDWRALQPGMVMTVEPGLYVAPDDDSVDARWRGIGIRIEDDILITQDGWRNLTQAVPTSIDDIEHLMRQ